MRSDTLRVWRNCHNERLREIVWPCHARNMPCIESELVCSFIISRLTHTQTHTDTAPLLAKLKSESSVKSWGTFVHLSLHSLESTALMCDFLLAAYRLHGSEWVTDEESPSAEGVPLWEMPNVLGASQKYYMWLSLFDSRWLFIRSGSERVAPFTSTF